MLFCLQRSVTAGGNTSASHYASTSAVHASSYDGVTYSSQHEEAAPVADQEPDPKDNTAVIAATTDEEGLQSDDVTLEVAGEFYIICCGHVLRCAPPVRHTTWFQITSEEPHS